MGSTSILHLIRVLTNPLPRNFGGPTPGSAGFLRNLKTAFANYSSQMGSRTTDGSPSQAGHRGTETKAYRPPPGRVGGGQLYDGFGTAG